MRAADAEHQKPASAGHDSAGHRPRLLLNEDVPRVAQLGDFLTVEEKPPASMRHRGDPDRTSAFAHTARPRLWLYQQRYAGFRPFQVCTTVPPQSRTRPSRSADTWSHKAPAGALHDLEQPAPGAARIDTFKAELTRLEGELSRYAEAIANAGPLATILEAVKVRERRRDAVRMELKSLSTPARAKMRDSSEIRAELVDYLNNSRDMARQGVAKARHVLRTVLVSRFGSRPCLDRPISRRGRDLAESRDTSTSSRAKRHSPDLSRG